MLDALPKAVRAAAKGSGWSVKRDVLSKRSGEYALAVHPRRGSRQCIEFRAKPIIWDQLLWSILQIEGNEKQPISFHFWGTFICDCPALIQEAITTEITPEKVAKKMVRLAAQVLEAQDTWRNFNLVQAIEGEYPLQPYRYHMTQVVERIASNDRHTAQTICEAALRGTLDVRRTFSSTDRLSAPDAEGQRESRSFFELAQLWMQRN